MLEPDAIEWFLASCGEDPGSRYVRARVEPVADVGIADMVPIDLLALILAHVWRVDRCAPRLAATSFSFFMASEEAEVLVEGVDVPVPRKCVTVPARSSIQISQANELLNNFREIRSAWGMRLENYKDFNVCVPRLDNQVRVAYDQNDMANLLDHGSVSGYLNNIRKNNMSSITDIKVHFCRQRSFSESLN